MDVVHPAVIRRGGARSRRPVLHSARTGLLADARLRRAGYEHDTVAAGAPVVVRRYSSGGRPG